MIQKAFFEIRWRDALNIWYSCLELRVENAELEENKRESGTHSLFHFFEIDRERYIMAGNKHTEKEKTFTLKE